MNNAVDTLYNVVDWFINLKIMIDFIKPFNPMIKKILAAVKDADDIMWTLDSDKIDRQYDRNQVNINLYTVFNFVKCKRVIIHWVYQNNLPWFVWHLLTFGINLYRILLFMVHSFIYMMIKDWFHLLLSFWTINIKEKEEGKNLKKMVNDKLN